jgi:hypothetical protein
MLRALIVSVLMLALAGRAEAAAVLGGDRDAWLRGFDGGAETRVQVTAWTAGVNETLFLVVHTLGCKNQEPVSGYTLAGRDRRSAASEQN